MDVDPQFRQSRAASRRRQRQRQLQLAALGGLGALGIGAVGLLAFWLMNRPTSPPDDIAADSEQIVQVETETAAAAVHVATPFVDIPGDPMILRFETGAARAAKPVAGADTLDTGRFGFSRPDRFSLIREDLIVRESQLITALPSSREDFAFFQAQRSRSLDVQPTLPALVTTPEVATGETGGELVTLADDDGSFGQALGGGDDHAPLTYVNTRIQNTTSVAFLRPEPSRQKLSQDLVLRLDFARPLDEVLTANGFQQSMADELVAAAQRLVPGLAAISGEDGLVPGTIIALRYRPVPDAPEPLQISFYGPDGYIDSLARRGTVGYVQSADPWLDTDLLELAAPERSRAAAAQDYRLLDAVYSALIRNGMPTTLVGELIVLLSQSYDLEAIAAAGDQVTVLYAPDGPAGPGQIAFVGISGPSGDMPCYVARKSSAGPKDFACFSRQGQRGGGGAGGAFVTPVQGTLSSPFGPRFHPVLKEVRLHGGVDWAAPTGTPIVAALPGRIAVAGDGGSYGNVIYIDHADGVQSRYAHLDRFAPTIRVGVQVNAGDHIGYVGTTGRSTGPHLHFEIRQNGAPIDPFALGGGGSLVASAAVEALTDQIIRVESAGNANARNPLSTATGLGQFIESTWLRMMRDYRPDLARTMARDELLALRTDPTLSREMVQNLARENENFLRARGHQVDAGRLYLAHFLGPAGASTVLGAPDDQTVLVVMGAAVVRANPFLTNYTVADLKAWAARKMRGAGSGGPRRQPLPPEIQTYIQVIDTILQQDV